MKMKKKTKNEDKKSQKKDKNRWFLLIDESKADCNYESQETVRLIYAIMWRIRRNKNTKQRPVLDFWKLKTKLKKNKEKQLSKD